MYLWPSLNEYTKAYSKGSWSNLLRVSRFVRRRALQFKIGSTVAPKAKTMSTRRNKMGPLGQNHWIPISPSIYAWNQTSEVAHYAGRRRELLGVLQSSCFHHPHDSLPGHRVRAFLRPSLDPCGPRFGGSGSSLFRHLPLLMLCVRLMFKNTAITPYSYTAAN